MKTKLWKFLLHTICMEVHVFIKITAVKILLRYYSPCFISQGQWPPRAPYKLVQLNTYNDFTGVWTLSQQGNLIPMTQNGLQVYKLEHASLSLQKDAFVIILETTSDDRFSLENVWNSSLGWRRIMTLS